jgi:hypothetical protein
MLCTPISGLGHPAAGTTRLVSCCSKTQCLSAAAAAAAAVCCCHEPLLLLLLQATVGQEPNAFNILPIAVAGFASKKLGLSRPPKFKRFEDVLTLFKPVRADGRSSKSG